MCAKILLLHCDESIGRGFRCKIGRGFRSKVIANAEACQIALLIGDETPKTARYDIQARLKKKVWSSKHSSNTDLKH
jgi:hypothetical protein